MQLQGNKKQRATAAKAQVDKRLWKHRQEKKERALELMRCGSTFGIKELGEGPKHRHKGFIAKRIKCLDQVRLKSPPLPLSVEAHWERRKLAYARECCYTYRETTGSQFLKTINPADR